MKPVNIDALTTKAKIAAAFLRLSALDDIARDEMISSGFGNARPSDVEKAIRENNFPRGAEKLWRKRAEITATLNAIRYASEARFGVHPLDLPGVRDKYYAQYEKRPKKYAGETSVTGNKNPARFTYLLNRLTGRIIQTKTPLDFFNSSNIMSDGEPVFERLTKYERDQLKARNSDRDMSRSEIATFLYYLRERVNANKPASKRVSVTGAKNPVVNMAALRKEAKALGMTVTKSEDGEYRIAFKSNREASAYYTDDAEDALGTMRAMAKEGDRYTARGKKNPAPKSAALYVLRAHHENGAVYFLTKANKLSTEKKDAERFKYADTDGVLRWLEDRLPKTIKYCDAVKA